MNSQQLDNIFCPKHSDCLAPISVITEILSKNDPKKFKEISIQFNLLGFKKVKDLANATLGKASSIKLHGDSLTLLYKAIEIYSKRLDDLLERARVESRNGNFVKTQEICMTLLMQKPANLNVLILIADSYFMLEDYDICIEYLKTAHTINANCSEINMNLGLAFWKKNENTDAKFYISTACLSKPKRLVNWITYADFLFSLKNYGLAKVLYEFILRSKTGLFKVHHNYGKLLVCLNNLEGAERQLKIALGIAPTFQEGLNSLADLYYIMNKFDKAILFYLKSLSINPDDKSIIFNLGMANYKAKYYRKAAEAFRKAISIDPTYFSALMQLAVTYNHDVKLFNNSVLSVETFKKCLVLEPNNYNVNYELAMINFNNLNNFQEAVIYFKKCIELNPEEKKPYKHLFTVYVMLGKSRPEASDLYITLGDLYVKDNDLETARSAYICSVYLDPENALIHWKLGVTYYKLGAKDLALNRLKYAIFLKPTFWKPYRDTAIIFEEKGNHNLANEYYRAALQLQPDDNGDLRQRINQLDERMVALEINNESV